MAADTTLPRIVPMAVTAFVGVAILFGLKFVFDSYFIEMFEAEEYVKVGSVEPKELHALRAAELKSFASAPVPLDKALDIVAHNRASSDVIRPEPSNDLASLEGWAELPKTGLGSLPPHAAASASAAPLAPALAVAPSPALPSAPAAPGPAPSPAPHAVPPTGAPAPHPVPSAPPPPH